MMRTRLALLALVAACGFDDAGSSGDDSPTSDGGPSDGGASCGTVIELDPPQPIADAATVVRATAKVLNAPGVIAYHWAVTFGGAPVATDFAQADQSAITFATALAGVYRLRLTIEGPVSCPEANVDLNVLAPGANMTQVRLHVTPPASADAPPLDKLVPVTGGASFSLGNVVLDPGSVAAGEVRQGTTPIAAYLRFMPAAGKEAIVETFSNPISGTFSVRVLNQPHDVLVVPVSSSIAPRLIEDWTPGMMLVVGNGTAVTGTVRGPGGGALAGAQVLLMIDGVPSTPASTNASGAFTLLAVIKPGAPVAVAVTPPATSGLPRLDATAAFDLAQPIAVAYGALALRDVGGAVVSRGGALPNARLTLVGSVSAAGTVTAGGAPVAAVGTVRVAAVANGTGVLPPTLAPARPLAAVVESPVNTFAVSSVDLTGGAPSTIAAPAPENLITRIRRLDLTGISGVAVDLVPVGALALAGATPLRATSAPTGTIDVVVAGGGHYELRFADPAARGAPLIVPDVTATTAATAYTLRKGLLVSGSLIRPNTVPVGGASVQILCSLCTGLERDRPLAEATSSPSGAFVLVVPDPGTM
jgi:hypothetical protein